jgi:hypothetical protein
VALVLCTGNDYVLIETRRLILEYGGHTVVPATSDKDISQAALRYSFDVAVIGQSMNKVEKERVFKIVRATFPGAKVLELHPQNAGRILESADDWLAVPADVPVELAERVTALAARR